MHRCMFVLPFLLLGCSSNNDTPPTQAPLRPGFEDSSKAYIGTPSKSEIAIWEAVRAADADARKSAIASLKADLVNDPANGYSAFLVSATAFIQGAELLNDLAAGQPVPTATAVPALSLPADTAPFFEQALQHLTDPFYIGIDATLLAVIQRQTDPVAAEKTQQLADSTNFVASSVGRTTTTLAVGDSAGALEFMYQLLKYCNHGVLDREHPDLEQFVATANAAGFVQRECYSGYYAMHATEGELLQIGDLFTIAGNPELASLYYNATRSATNYDTWPLKPLAERRIAGTQTAAAGDLPAVIACATCHVNEVR